MGLAKYSVPAEFRLGFRVDDGGRRAAGFPVQRDCSVRAVAIATGMSYRDAYVALAGLRPTGGVDADVSDRLLAAAGFTYTATAGRTVRLRTDELPRLALMVIKMWEHLTVVADGTILDTGDPTLYRRGMVLGWWRRSVGGES